jgi:hypothetical protein
MKPPNFKLAHHKKKLHIKILVSSDGASLNFLQLIYIHQAKGIYLF